MLTISTDKAGAKKLSLSTNKSETFRVKLRWKSEHDVDAHALLAHNAGGKEGAKVEDLVQVLSTHNTKKTNPE